MAFPSSNINVARRAFDAILGAAGAIKFSAERLHDASAAGNIEAQAVVDFLRDLAMHNDVIVTNSGAPGLLDYARAQINDPALDIAGEYQTMLTQINATRDWCLTNFPKDANGYLLYHTFSAAGRIVQRTFAPADTAGLRTQLAALIATIA